MYNPIRSTLEREFKIPAETPKPLLNLALGEPTKANGYPLPEEMKQAIIEVIESEKCNGYTKSTGAVEARQAVVDKFSTPENPFTADDVFLTAGCSGALIAALHTLCEEGDNILLPRPGFPLATCICQNINVQYRFYDLLPEKDWEVDLASMEKLIDERTSCIVVNNPSNPCGSVYSKKHLEEIVALSDKHRVPLLADEVYHGLAYDASAEFTSLAHVAPNTPMIRTGAISKIYCVPGWRLGWVIVHNKHGYFDDLIVNINKMSMVALHPNSLV